MKAKQLRKLDKALSVAIVIFGIIAFLSVFGMIGGVGNYDFADEAHIIMTPEEQHETDMIILWSTISFVVSGVVIWFCEKLQQAIVEELECRKQRYLARKEKERIEQERIAEQRAEQWRKNFEVLNNFRSHG